MSTGIPDIHWHSKQIGSPYLRSTCYFRSYLYDLAYWRLFYDNMASQQSKGDD